MEKAKVLVTGGAGFIGSHLVDQLLSDGHHVALIDNLSNGKMANLDEARKQAAFTFVNGDILSSADCDKACTGVDYVFHLACLGVRHSLHSPFENHRVNAEGTLRMLESARQHKVKHFFYISTSEIYGRTTSFPISEHAETNPLTVYGSSKLAGEHYTHSYRECFGMPSTVLRIFNNYGPRAHHEGDAGEVIPRSIVRILNRQQPIIFGNGLITRDFFFVKDTARCLASLVALRDKLNGETINIGTGEEITMKELLEKLLVNMNRQTLGIKYLPDRPADVPRLWVDNSKFKKMIPFKARFSFENGLKETIDYYSALPALQNMVNEIKEKNWQ